MPKKYARALFELLKEKDVKDDVIKRFLAYLDAKSKLKLLPKILHELEKLIEADAKRAPQILLGNEKAKDAALKTADMLGVKEAPVKTDEKLIGGFMIKGQNFLWDASYRRFLLDLYEKLKS